MSSSRFATGAQRRQHEAAWTEVIDRRMKDIAEERVDLVDAADAMAQARAVTAARR